MRLLFVINAAVDLGIRCSSQLITKESILDVVKMGEFQSFPALSEFDEALSRAENAPAWSEQLIAKIVESSEGVGEKAAALANLAKQGIAPNDPKQKMRAFDNASTLAYAIQESAERVVSALRYMTKGLPVSISNSIKIIAGNLRKTQTALVALGRKIDRTTFDEHLPKPLTAIEELEKLAASWAAPHSASVDDAAVMSFLNRTQFQHSFSSQISTITYDEKNMSEIAETAKSMGDSAAAVNKLAEGIAEGAVFTTGTQGRAATQVYLIKEAASKHLGHVKVLIKNGELKAPADVQHLREIAANLKKMQTAFLTLGHKVSPYFEKIIPESLKEIEELEKVVGDIKIPPSKPTTSSTKSNKWWIGVLAGVFAAPAVGAGAFFFLFRKN